MTYCCITTFYQFPFSHQHSQWNHSLIFMNSTCMREIKCSRLLPCQQESGEAWSLGYTPFGCLFFSSEASGGASMVFEYGKMLPVGSLITKEKIYSEAEAGQHKTSDRKYTVWLIHTDCMFPVNYQQQAPWTEFVLHCSENSSASVHMTTVNMLVPAAQGVQLLQNGTVYLSTVSRVRIGDTRWQAITQGELDGGHSRASTQQQGRCSSVEGKRGGALPEP